jgi:hypothetical protein
MCIVFGVVAILVSTPAGFVYEPYFFLPLLWLGLFFGAAILPAASGSMIITS